MSLLSWWFTAAPPSASTTPGFSIFLTPWMDMGKSRVGTWTRSQASAALGGGFIDESVIAVNNSMTWDVWMDVGTYKYAQIYYSGTNRGIYTVQLNAVSKGTIDSYSAAGTYNVYTELTGVVLSTAAINAYTILGATKNATSTDYDLTMFSAAWIRTGA